MLRVDLIDVIKSFSKSSEVVFEFEILTQEQSIQNGFSRASLWRRAAILSSLSSRLLGFVISIITGIRITTFKAFEGFERIPCLLLQFELFILFLLPFLLVSLSCFQCLLIDVLVLVAGCSCCGRFFSRAGFDFGFDLLTGSFGARCFGSEGGHVSLCS